MNSPTRSQHAPRGAATSENTPASGYAIRRNHGGEQPVDTLLAPDGSVTIPATVAGDLLRALVRDLTARVRVDGGEVAPGVRRVLYALHAAAQHAEQTADDRARHEIEHTPDNGTAPTNSATVDAVSVAEAAAALECRPEYVRRLARRGDLAAHRLGRRTWAIDRASLDHYRYGRTRRP